MSRPGRLRRLLQPAGRRRDADRTLTVVYLPADGAGLATFLHGKGEPAQPLDGEKETGRG